MRQLRDRLATVAGLRLVGEAEVNAGESATASARHLESGCRKLDEVLDISAATVRKVDLERR